MYANIAATVPKAALALGSWNAANVELYRTLFLPPSLEVASAAIVLWTMASVTGRAISARSRAHVASSQWSPGFASCVHARHDRAQGWCPGR